MKTKEFDPFLQNELKDPELAAEYLSAAIENGAIEELLVALRNVADAHGGLGTISEITSLNRQNLYKMLAEDGNPTLESLIAIVNALGIKLSFTPKEGDDIAA
jgi:probable addiction module antidote protein